MRDQDLPEPERPDPEAGTETNASVPEEIVPKRKRPSNKILALTLFPIITISVIGTLVNVVFRVSFVADHPLLLLMNDPRTLHMLLVVERMDWYSYYPVVIIRRLIADPSHFLLGMWFGHVAIQWIKRHSPELGDMAVKLEEWFPKYGWFLVIVYPHPLVMVIAGASKMRFRTFMLLDFIGVLGVAIAVDLFGDVIHPQVEWINGFIAAYQWQLTAGSIGLFLLMYLISGRNKERQTTRSTIDELRDSDHDWEDDRNRD